MGTQKSNNVLANPQAKHPHHNHHDQGGFPYVSSTFPAFGFVKLWQIIGCEKRGIPPVIPVSSTAWNDGVKAGIYPKSVKISARSVAWKAEDIISLYHKFSSGEVSL